GGDPIVTVGTAQISFPSFQGVSGGVSNLVVYSNGFTLGSADVKVAPAGGINLLNLLGFNDLQGSVNNFRLYTTTSNGNPTTHFLSTGPGGTSGIPLSSGGVQFLPGKAVSGSITDGPDADKIAVSATFNFDSSGLQSFVFSADTLTLNLGSFLTLSATGFQ